VSGPIVRTSRVFAHQLISPISARSRSDLIASSLGSHDQTLAFAGSTRSRYSLVAQSC